MSYSGDGDDQISLSHAPEFRFLPPRREVVQRLIMRATIAKNDKEFTI